MECLGFVELLRARGFNNIIVGSNDDIEDAVMWLNSLYAFFRLGIDKQNRGLNPRIYISW